MNAEFPASMGRAMLIDGDKVCSSANPPAGLWPVENVVIVQEFASGLEVISLHRSPESRDDLPAVMCIACHGCQLYIHAKGQCLFKLPSPRNISAGTVPGVVINHGRGRRPGRGRSDAPPGAAIGEKDACKYPAENSGTAIICVSKRYKSTSELRSTALICRFPFLPDP